MLFREHMLESESKSAGGIQGRWFKALVRANPSWFVTVALPSYFTSSYKLYDFINMVKAVISNKPENKLLFNKLYRNKWSFYLGESLTPASYFVFLEKE